MKASVIVLSWNGMDYLKECLDAVCGQGFPAWELIVVDNSSTDGSADFVAAHYPAVHLIRCAENKGFAAGNNAGLRVAAGDVIVLLNQDTAVQPQWLGELVHAFERDPTCGIAGGKALYPGGRIQHAGGHVDGCGNAGHYGHGELDRGQYEVLRETDYITGATLAISRAALQAVGGLDEGFRPAYYEDVDWCFRARKAGFRVLYVPSAVLVHKEASAAATQDHDGMYFFHRNRLRLVLKHWSREQLLSEFLPAERTWLESLDMGGERLVAAMHRAYLYHLLHLDEIVDCRAQHDAEAEVDALAGVLLSLRTVFPLQTMARLESSAASTDEEYVALNNLGTIELPDVPSRRPLVGPLLDHLRRMWYRHFIAPYVAPLSRQQSAFNHQVTARLGQMAQAVRSERTLPGARVDRLEQLLSEYLAEAGRERSDLAQQVRELLDALEQQASHLDRQ